MTTNMNLIGLGEVELLESASITDDGKSYWQYAKLDNGESALVYWDIIADDDEADNCCDWSSPAAITQAGQVIWERTE